ncbi:MAG: Binding-protein-dependent transport systems inner membrane component [Mesotoga infera]|uniref:Binding-protein-dependent transport systems inner membrane component n=1 Tax=Mesotoga infera TaxID=1236046 RepID=A0A117M838_9BACT|nr:MAG: Binding-protein-dependent transport systems inner membrane component [Mesotoga infera]
MILYLLKPGIEQKKARWGLIFVIPSIIFFSLFSFYPIFTAFYTSFFNKKLLSLKPPDFIGFQNYTYLLKSPDFWNSMRATAAFTIGTFIPIVILSLILANFIISRKRLISTMVVYGWKYLGYFTIIFIVGLTTIPQSTHEAALIDGASKWQDFLYITLPLLKPTTLLVSVMSMLQCLKTFSTQYLFTQGGAPLAPINVITLNIYHTAIRDHRIGRASAMSIILFFIMLIFTWLQFRVSHSEEVSY